MTRYKIQISEPWNFKHLNGTNTFTVKGLGIIAGPQTQNFSDEYFLVEVEEPFEMGGDIVKQLACSPRYQDDNIKMIVSSECSIGICIIKSDFKWSIDDVFKPNEASYLAVGSIKAI